MWGFLVVVLVYLVIIQVGGLLLVGEHGSADGRLLTVDDVLYPMTIPLAIALVFAYGVAAALGWMRPVLHDDRGVRRWLWSVPIAFVVTIVAVTNYAQLAGNGLAFTLVLLVTTQLIGWGEEAMFRGLGVTTFRVNGYTEGKVALWTCVIFGAVHLSNAISRGVGALPQAVVVSLAGYFFYLMRRVSRGNVLNAVLHGLFDFALISATAIMPADEPGYPTAVLAIVLYVVLGIVLLVRRHHIEPPAGERDWT